MATADGTAEDPNVVSAFFLNKLSLTDCSVDYICFKAMMIRLGTAKNSDKEFERQQIHCHARPSLT